MRKEKSRSKLTRGYGDKERTDEDNTELAGADIPHRECLEALFC